MIEVYPKKINEENVQASLQKLVAAFLDVAEDLAQEEEMPAIQIKDVRKMPAGL